MTVKHAEKIIDKEFPKHMHGIQFNIMDLSKIKTDLVKQLIDGIEVPEAFQTVAAKYRKN